MDAGQRRAIAVWDYQAREDGELSFHAGDIIKVVEENHMTGWFRGELGGKVGEFPSNYCELIGMELQHGQKRLSSVAVMKIDEGKVSPHIKSLQEQCGLIFNASSDATEEREEVSSDDGEEAQPGQEKGRVLSSHLTSEQMVKKLGDQAFSLVEGKVTDVYLPTTTTKDKEGDPEEVQEQAWKNKRDDNEMRGQWKRKRKGAYEKLSDDDDDDDIDYPGNNNNNKEEELGHYDRDEAREDKMRRREEEFEKKKAKIKELKKTMDEERRRNRREETEQQPAGTSHSDKKDGEAESNQPTVQTMAMYHQGGESISTIEEEKAPLLVSNKGTHVSSSINKKEEEEERTLCATCCSCILF